MTPRGYRTGERSDPVLGWRTQSRCQPTTVSGRTAPPRFASSPRLALRRSKTASHAPASAGDWSPASSPSVAAGAPGSQHQFLMSTESQRQRTTDDDQQLEHVSIPGWRGRQNQLRRVLARVRRQSALCRGNNSDRTSLGGLVTGPRLPFSTIAYRSGHRKQVVIRRRKKRYGLSRQLIH